MQVIHEHNQQQQQQQYLREEQQMEDDAPLPSSTTTSNTTYNPTTTSATRAAPRSLSPVLLGLLASTAVLRVIWGDLRVPAGVDATTLLPADAQV